MGKSAVAEKVRDIGEVVGPKAREIRDSVGPKAREIREAVGPKAHEIGETIKPKVKQARRKVGFWIAGEEPKKAKKWPAFAAAGIGALTAFFFDPASGKRRRLAAKDWVVAKVTSVRRRVGPRVESETPEGLPPPLA